jgi:predicted transcriptional regulator
MKIKNITVGIKSVAESLKEFTQVVKNIRRGVVPKATREEVNFVSLEAMRKVLTPKRLELIHTIREQHPQSVYELAQMAKRDLKNVQQDIGLLSRIGLVSLGKRSSAREPVVPIVDYDNLQLQIPVV